MIGRLLIDECLTPELVQMAIEAGHVESTCLRDRGWLGLKDWQLMRHVLDGDFILVTRNAWDFRGEGAGSPSGLHARVEVHAGLICLDAVEELDFDLQRELFRIALAELTELDDLINQALDIFLDEGWKASVEIYEIPSPGRSVDGVKDTTRNGYSSGAAKPVLLEVRCDEQNHQVPTRRPGCSARGWRDQHGDDARVRRDLPVIADKGLKAIL